MSSSFGALDWSSGVASSVATPPQQQILTVDAQSQRLVLSLYDALSNQNTETVKQIIAPELEWWFHGPPTHQFMMRLLTGVTSHHHNKPFHFQPLTIESIDSFIIAEGCDHSGSITWIHVWTVKDGIITQLREYFNTSLTVTRLSDPSSRLRCNSIWESSLSNMGGKSVPGLLLPI